MSSKIKLTTKIKQNLNNELSTLKKTDLIDLTP